MDPALRSLLRRGSPHTVVLCEFVVRGSDGSVVACAETLSSAIALLSMMDSDGSVVSSDGEVLAVRRGGRLEVYVGVDEDGCVL